jgi:type II secretory pathway pseudopilin PulG
MADRSSRAFSLIGLLITMACVVVLFSILMTSMNKAVTGEGSAVQGTVASVEDQLHLYAINLGLSVYAGDNGGRYPVPSEISGSGDRSEDTTANFYSAMIARQYVRPEDLIAGNEYSSWIEADDDYDYGAYQPLDGVYWDSAFAADLEEDIANVSYAHMPMYGERFRRYWRNTMSGTMPLIGNRGPRNGVPDTNSLTYGRNGQWGGHVLYSDGAIEFITTFTPPRVTFRKDGVAVADNIFAMEDGPGGSDAIIAFTRSMTDDGPVLQYD